MSGHMRNSKDRSPNRDGYLVISSAAKSLALKLKEISIFLIDDQFPARILVTRIECVSASVDRTGEPADDRFGESLDRDVIQKARPSSTTSILYQFVMLQNKIRPLAFKNHLTHKFYRPYFILTFTNP